MFKKSHLGTTICAAGVLLLIGYAAWHMLSHRPG